MKILDLNEHCLLDVFRYLPPTDICAVRDTCVRFREVAEIHMATFFQSNELVLTSRTRNAYKVLFKFGAVLRKLNIDSVNWEQRRVKEILSVLRKSNPKLDSLTISDRSFELALSRLRPLFGNLRKINLEYFNNDFGYDIRREETIKAICKACTNIEELSFGAKISAMGSCYQGIFLQQKFKNLHTLELNEVRFLDLNNLKLFFKLNPNVHRLFLKRSVSLERLSDFNFTEYAPNITGVSLKFNETDHIVNQNTHLPLANQFFQLKKLECLALDSCCTDITRFVAKLAERNTLVYLSLNNVVIKMNEGLGDAFANMNNLKVLRLDIIFYNPVGQDLFKVLCKNLVNLEELYVHKCNLDYQQIGDIIDNSISLQKLYLPSLKHMALNEDLYLEFVGMQYRKKRKLLPLTIFVEDYFSYPIVMRNIPGHTLQINSNIIKVSKFIMTDLDDYMLPYSV